MAKLADTVLPLWFVSNISPQTAKIGHTAIYLAPDSSHNLSWCHRGINPLCNVSEELAADMRSSCDLLTQKPHCFKC